MTGLDLGFWGIYVVAIGIIAWGGVQVRSFLGQHSSICDQADLDRYKAMVRTQMYLTLLLIGLLIAGLFVGIGLYLQDRLLGMAYFVLANGAVAVTSLFNRNLEKRVRSLPTTSPELENEYRRVSESWVKKPLPDF